MAIKALLILSGLDFQSQSIAPFAPKAHDIFRQLSASPEVDVEVVQHIDRSFRIWSAYGLQFWQLPGAFSALVSSFPILFKGWQPSSSNLSSNVRGDAVANFVRASLENYWLGVLNAKRPDVILGIGLNEDLVRLARGRGIATIEIQHGILSGPEAYWREVRPDGMFQWPSTAGDAYLRVGIRPIKIPFPSSMSKRLKSPGVYQYVGAKAPVLVFLTEGLDSSWDGCGTVSFQLIDYCEALRDRDSTTSFLFRFHPKTPKKTRRIVSRKLANKLKGSSFKFSKSRDVRADIAQASFAVVGVSTAWLDCAQSGLPVVMTNEDFARHQRETSDSFLVKFMRSPLDDVAHFSKGRVQINKQLPEEDALLLKSALEEFIRLVEGKSPVEG